MEKWNAVYTRKNSERKVSSLLKKRKIENYLPLKRIIKNKNEPANIKYELIFESFVFIKLSENKMNSILDISDVVNLVYWLGKPAIFNDFEIISMRNFLSHHYNVVVEKMNVDTEQEILFVSKSFYNQNPDNENENTIISNSQIKLQLPSLGYVLIADTHDFNSRLYEQTGKIVELVF